MQYYVSAYISLHQVLRVYSSYPLFMQMLLLKKRRFGDSISNRLNGSDHGSHASQERKLCGLERTLGIEEMMENSISHPVEDLTVMVIDQLFDQDSTL